MDQFGVRKSINRNVYKAMLFLQSSNQSFLVEDEIANRVKKQMRGKKDCADMEIHQSLFNLAQLGIITCFGSSNYSVSHYLNPAGLFKDLKKLVKAKVSRKKKLDAAIKKGRVTKAKTRVLKKRGERDVPNPIRIQNFPMANSAVMCNECMPVVRRFTRSMGSLNLGGSPSDFVKKEKSDPEETQENPKRQVYGKTNETGKVFIVTGSNTGIGKETVWELARRGATVYMACRDKVRAEEARREIIEDTKNQNIFFIELDLSSLDSVRKFVEVYKQQEDRLDVLINNAGVMLGPRKLTKEGFEWQLGVNHMGPFLLTILLLDLLKKSAPSRIVNVSSVSHSYGNLNIKDLNSEKSYSEVGAYNQSKLANVLFTRELAARLEGTGVTVNALHPGVVDTDITRNIIFLKINFGKGVKYMAKPFIKSAKSGAQTTLYAALHPDLERVTGLYFVDCKPKNVSKAATNEETAKFLWTESEKWTGAPTVPLN